ncbi:hypothetical protein P168DRAFT_283780 [Aspergillus campestris IBT 28561]|uniref:DUF6536 domain-containing protein n=1 Tax=Aspergillus campestris (strain IBT 28561) TaxID=1392248 RepID=A0A2I1CWL7_ASPC2|nr:uncharacterized protein P168DRAFT_283780 [Aspergillus campestris IBT 28561]PKY02017.1 hypothetical protein P168DRAFT_283780 [Aspergillus campestris IBT 28561]
MTQLNNQFDVYLQNIRDLKLRNILPTSPPGNDPSAVDNEAIAPGERSKRPLFVLNLTLIIWAVANGSLEDVHTACVARRGNRGSENRLVSPTRAEVDQAHLRGKSLNIGVPSLRNLLHISRVRLILCLVLLVTSLPLHIFYNSVISTALGAYQYRVVLTTPEQLQVGSNPNFAYMRDHLTSHKRLEPLECLESYPVEHTMNRADVIVVLEDYTSHEFLEKNFSQVIESGNGGYGGDYSWQCCFPLLEYMNDQYAIASFLEDPDPETIHASGLFNKREKQRKLRHNCLYQSMSKARRTWFLTVWLTVLVIAIGGVLSVVFMLTGLQRLGLSSFENLEERNSDAMWSTIGFGGSETYNRYPVIPMLLLANTPQLVLSLLYLLYNSTITSMLLSREWNQIGHRRKSLRVTVPSGEQRSTYYLSMSLKWAFPLMAISALLHWLLSQSIYPVMTYGYELNPDGTPVRLKDQTVTSCSYSTGAMILVVATLIIATILFVVMARRRLKPEMPVLAVSSWVVSAACHSPEGDTDAAVKAVQWGVPVSPMAQETGIEGPEEDACEHEDAGLWAPQMKD